MLCGLPDGSESNQNSDMPSGNSSSAKASAFRVVVGETTGSSGSGPATAILPLPEAKRIEGCRNRREGEYEAQLVAGFL